MNLHKLIKEELNSILDEDLYHGSPYDFEEFLTDYMGSGEGNQSFGWGLYFTELEDIAKHYADKLRLNKVLIGGKTIDKVREEIDSPVISWIESYYTEYGLNKDQIIEKLEDQLEDKEWLEKNKWVETGIKKVLEYIKDKDIEGDYSGRNLYKIVLNKKNLTWLDWDSPIPDSIYETIGYKLKYNGKYLRELFDDSKKFERTDGSFVSGNKPNGLLFYKRISQILGSDKDASLFLLKHGIDGIKYPAESITKAKTSENNRGFNYVIFDPSIIKIEKKIKY